ncbi:MAG: RNA polymerase sigma factor, partial [Candidatus Omnitrophica bacterium]|nr:RNA polymerase sigma factor [Candidatus Omnitrophota bacterium]
MHELTDEQVMLKYQEGQMSALDELMQRYQNPIYSFAYRLSHNASEAQDIAQEVFLRIHQARASYAPSGKFSTFIFSIAHNLCVSRLRRRRWLALWPTKAHDSDEPVDFQSPDPSPGEAAEEQEYAALVKACIQGLPFLQKEALILREYEQMNYVDIAKILHMSLGAIKTLIFRARQTLKSKLLP